MAGSPLDEPSYEKIYKILTIDVLEKQIIRLYLRTSQKVNFTFF